MTKSPFGQEKIKIKTPPKSKLYLGLLHYLAHACLNAVPKLSVCGYSMVRRKGTECVREAEGWGVGGGGGGLLYIYIVLSINGLKQINAEGRAAILMSPPCLESQGCQFDPTFLYLLSCSSA